MPINIPILDDGRGAPGRRRSSMAGGARRSSSVFRRNSDIAVAMGTENILLKLSHKRSEEELAKVRKFLLETDGLRPLCTALPERALDELCQYVKIEDYRPEELICKEGESGDKLFFILSGTATEYKSTNSIERTVQQMHRIDSNEKLDMHNMRYGATRQDAHVRFPSFPLLSNFSSTAGPFSCRFD